MAKKERTDCKCPWQRKKEHTKNACGKERPNHKCLWQRKKEQTTNVCGKERKAKPQMLVANEKWLPYSGKQTADTKWKKQNSWNHLKTPNGCLPANIRWKKRRKKERKNPPNHNSLIEYCLQQRSGRLQSEEHRVKIIVSTTNRWKAKLTKLTPH